MRRIIWTFVILSPVIALARSTHADPQTAQLAAQAAAEHFCTAVTALRSLLA